jgi:hypothetical protein
MSFLGSLKGCGGIGEDISVLCYDFLFDLGVFGDIERNREGNVADVMSMRV